MKAYQELSKEELVSLKAELEKKFEDAKGKGLKLDMSRGKPSVAQLDMGMDIFDVLNSTSDLTSMEGIDVRNYGVLDGILEAKNMMADIMGVTADHVIVYGKMSVISGSRTEKLYLIQLTPGCIPHNPMGHGAGNGVEITSVSIRSPTITASAE